MKNKPQKDSIADKQQPFVESNAVVAAKNAHKQAANKRNKKYESGDKV